MASSNVIGEDETSDNDTNDVNEHWPLWRYVVKQTKLGAGDKAASMREMAKTKDVPLPRSESSSNQTAIGSISVSMNETHPSSFKLEGRAFNAQAREILDGEIGRMFYSVGLPFNLAKNPHFIKSYSLAANSNVSGFTPPGYNALRTKLLRNERSNIETLLEPTKGTWKTKGVSIVCDGWTDPQRRPLINFMAINEGGPMFIRSVNCQGEYKDKFFISTLIKDVITEVGVSNVVQVITDNAPVCKAARMLVEQAYPCVFWTPCVVHTLNLALKNIYAAKNTESNEITYVECHWISEIAVNAVMIRNFIMNHSMRFAMFTEFSKLKLLVVAETRFASMIIMLKRFRTVKDKPCLHLVYEMWDAMIFEVKKVIFEHEKKSDFEESCFWNVVRKVLEDRWSKSNTPLHCLAHSLNPRCTTEDWKKKHPHLMTPDHDPEVTKMRKIHLKRLFPDEET
ncbi:hypothetical protein ACS0TY_030609 [Phlomoides rotata]